MRRQGASVGRGAMPGHGNSGGRERATRKVACGSIFIISAPSGCGKTTLLRKLLEDRSLSFFRSVSMTSRPPREDERDGIDYSFVSKDEFRSRMAEGAFLEWEENFGNLYGTPRGPIEEALKKGENVLLSVDVKGAMNIRKIFPKETVLIFILPPSLKALEERLHKRKTDDSYVISNRLSIAKKEIAYKDRYDYRIVNDDLKTAYETLRAILIAEEHRSSHQKDLNESFL